MLLCGQILPQFDRKNCHQKNYHGRVNALKMIRKCFSDAVWVVLYDAVSVYDFRIMAASAGILPMNKLPK